MYANEVAVVVVAEVGVVKLLLTTSSVTNAAADARATSLLTLDAKPRGAVAAIF